MGGVWILLLFIGLIDNYLIILEKDALILSEIRLHVKI